MEADTGAIGGSGSHEFCALSEYGESEIAYCDSCDMAATTERAACVDDPAEDEPLRAMETVFTPGTKTIADVAAYLGLPESKTIKALLFEVEGTETRYAAAFLRGDRELNMTKLVNALDVPEHAVTFADEDAMGAVTGAVGGFTGPAGLHDCRILVDSELVGARNLCAGACKKDHHILNMNYARDYSADIVTDLKMIKEGDPCPACGAPVRIARGIEVGQVFKLGTKYSESMHAYYKDEAMQEHPIIMGCYGIGVTRTLAAIVEQHHDKDGIRWPMAVAPYHAIVTVVNAADPVQMELGERLYRDLLAAGVDALLDDRDERPGVKFKDADLIGLPIRITVGKKAAEGIVEFKPRTAEKAEEMSADAAAAETAERVRTAQ